MIFLVEAVAAPEATAATMTKTMVTGMTICRARIRSLYRCPH
jgi:hypothetical protein